MYYVHKAVGLLNVTDYSIINPNLTNLVILIVIWQTSVHLEVIYGRPM